MTNLDLFPLPVMSEHEQLNLTPLDVPIMTDTTK